MISFRFDDFVNYPDEMINFQSKIVPNWHFN